LKRRKWRILREPPSNRRSERYQDHIALRKNTIHGNEFRKKLWSVWRKITYGADYVKSCSYSEEPPFRLAEPDDS